LHLGPWKEKLARNWVPGHGRGGSARIPARARWGSVGKWWGGCRCLNLSTSMGGTRSKIEGGDRHDLEPKGTREDTRHEIYTGSGSRSSYPTSCLEYCALRLVLFPEGIGCSARYPALLYIVQGRVPSRLQGRSPSRITQSA
jgi:hypothetical protein